MRCSESAMQSPVKKRRIEIRARHCSTSWPPTRRHPPARAGGPDHENILRHHVIRHLRRKFLPPQTVSQGNGDGTFGGWLSDNVLIELAYDFARRELVENGPFLDGLSGKV